MLILPGRVFINIKVDGKPLDKSPDIFSTLTLSESVAGLFPAATLVLNDFSNKLTKDLALTDGNEVLITVGRDPSELTTVSRQYRVYGIRNEAAGVGPQLKVNCIYDAPSFITESAREHYRGTSTMVLQQIADKCKLYYCGTEAFNGKGTNDSQSWWNINRSRASFALLNVARNGYMDKHSAMCAAVTSLGELRYRNLTEVVALPIDQIKFMFAHSYPIAEDDVKRYKFYLVDRAQAHSDAGLMNNWQNYGSTRVVLSNTGVASVEESVAIKTTAPYLPINDQVSKTVKRARFDTSLLDCGNVSEKYERAFYQNTKQLALFSERVSILISEPTSVQLLDPVLYRQSTVDLKEPSNISDIYIVIGKTIYIKGGQYYAERLELVRSSLTHSGESNLKCAITPEKAASMAIPDLKIDPIALGLAPLVTSTSTGTATTAVNSSPTSTDPTKVAPLTTMTGGTLNPVSNNATKAASATSVTTKQLATAKSIQAASKATDAAGKAAKVASVKTAVAATKAVASIMTLVNLSKGGIKGILQNPAAAISAIGGVTSSLAEYNAAGGDLGSKCSLLSTESLNLANSTLNNPSFNDAVRIASMIKPGGLIENQAAIAGIMALNQTTGYAVNSTASLMNTDEVFNGLSSQPVGAETLAAFNSEIGVFNANSTTINESFANTWNSSLSILNNLPIPGLSSITQDSSPLLKTVAFGALNAPTTYEGSIVTSSAVSNSLMSALTGSSSQSLPWANPSSFNTSSDWTNPSWKASSFSDSPSWHTHKGGFVSRKDQARFAEIAANRVKTKAPSYVAQQTETDGVYDY